MSSRLELTGQIQASNPYSTLSQPSEHLLQLALASPLTVYDVVQTTDGPVAVATAGSVGQAWQELPCSESVDEIQLLLVQTDDVVLLRVGGEVPEITGDAVTWPVTITEGQTITFEAGTVEVAVEFEAGSTTAVSAARQINAAAALAGLTWLPATVSGTSLVLSGDETGAGSTLEVTAATAAVGFSAELAVGAGAESRVCGLALLQFDPDVSPGRVQISGTANVEVLVAGTAP
jgi:hypothetical protein